MKVIALDSTGWKSLAGKLTRNSLTKVVEEAAKEASKLLKLPDNLTIIIKPNLPHVIDVTGVGGSSFDDELLDITFDPKRTSDQDFKDNIKATIYHELNHVARYNKLKKWDYDRFDYCVLEGLATVFEREYSNAKPLWGEYDIKTIKDWVKELQKLKFGAIKWQDIMFKHPDGRRWIGYKIGTYIVDEAIKNSDKNVIDLTYMKAAEIIKLSKVI